MPWEIAHKMISESGSGEYTHEGVEKLVGYTHMSGSAILKAWDGPGHHLNRTFHAAHKDLQPDGHSRWGRPVHTGLFFLWRITATSLNPWTRP